MANVPVCRPRRRQCAVPADRVQNPEHGQTCTSTTPGREQPWHAPDLMLGYERELAPTLSASVDYIRTLGRDMHARYDLQPGGCGPAPDGPTRLPGSDVFGVLGEPYASTVYHARTASAR